MGSSSLSVHGKALGCPAQIVINQITIGSHTVLNVVAMVNDQETDMLLPFPSSTKWAASPSTPLKVVWCSDNPHSTVS